MVLHNIDYEDVMSDANTFTFLFFVCSVIAGCITEVFLLSVWYARRHAPDNCEKKHRARKAALLGLAVFPLIVIGSTAFIYWLIPEEAEPYTPVQIRFKREDDDAKLD